MPIWGLIGLAALASYFGSTKEDTVEEFIGPIPGNNIELEANKFFGDWGFHKGQTYDEWITVLISVYAVIKGTETASRLIK